MSLVQIAQAWYYYARGSTETRQIMAERLAICDLCPYKKQLNGLGQLVVSSINQQGSTYKCARCKCPLAAKTAHPLSCCPIGKWKQWDKPAG